MNKPNENFHHTSIGGKNVILTILFHNFSCKTASSFFFFLLVIERSSAAAVLLVWKPFVHFIPAFPACARRIRAERKECKSGNAIDLIDSSISCLPAA